MIVDAHTDVLLELVVRDGAEPSLELVLRRGEEGVFTRYWLPRLAAGGVGVQICPLYGEGARRRSELAGQGPGADPVVSPADR